MFVLMFEPCYFDEMFIARVELEQKRLKMVVSLNQVANVGQFNRIKWYKICQNNVLGCWSSSVKVLLKVYLLYSSSQCLNISEKIKHNKQQRVALSFH